MKFWIIVEDLMPFGPAEDAQAVLALGGAFHALTLYLSYFSNWIYIDNTS